MAGVAQLKMMVVLLQWRRTILGERRRTSGAYITGEDWLVVGPTNGNEHIGLLSARCCCMPPLLLPLLSAPLGFSKHKPMNISNLSVPAMQVADGTYQPLPGHQKSSRTLHVTSTTKI
jgi:hypothetical protein